MDINCNDNLNLLYMFKNNLILIFTIVLFNCSSSDDSGGPDNNSNLSLTVTASTSSAIVDEIIVVNVSADEDLWGIETSTDNFQTYTDRQTNYGTNTTLYFSFDTVGTKTIGIRAKTSDGKEATKSINVSIARGDAITITQVKVLSFHDINNTWDPEFDSTDPNRLADVFFVFLKPRLNIYDGSSSSAVWYTSPIKENQGDLTWNVSSDNLYISPEYSLRYTMLDNDGVLSQDLMLGPPTEYEIAFADYIATKPSIITLSVPSISLEVELTLDW